MKPLEMRTPGLEQIYNQKWQYQHHKKKLLRIYQSRKSQLYYDNNRAIQFQSLKQTKMKSFVNKFNRHHESIAKDNIKLLTKLQAAKSSLSKVTDGENKSHSFGNPFVKKRMFETEKQNMRISQKMKNMSSSLSQRRFIEDYSKSQKIKSRIMRYATEQNGIRLKSQKYFGDRNEQSNSVLSHISNKSRNSHSKSYSSPEPKKVFSKQALVQKSAASHYRKQDILRNRVETKQESLASIKLRMKLRPNNQEQGNPQTSQIGEKQQTFFATQPKKNKIIRLLKNKL